MIIKVEKDMLEKDITEIPNVDEKTIKYLRKKGCNTVEDVIDNEGNLNKKHYEHFKEKILWIVLNIREVEE